MLYAMEPTDADWYTLSGFWLSVVGLVVGWVSLAATFRQVQLARRSADAARDAAEATRRESAANFRRYLAATIHRQISEVETFVSDENWVAARLRCDDMAGCLAQLPETELAVGFREFARLYRAKATNPKKRVLQTAWHNLILMTKGRIDLLNAPFAPVGVV